MPSNTKAAASASKGRAPSRYSRGSSIVCTCSRKLGHEQSAAELSWGASGGAILARLRRASSAWKSGRMPVARRFPCSAVLFPSRTAEVASTTFSYKDA